MSPSKITIQMNHQQQQRHDDDYDDVNISPNNHVSESTTTTTTTTSTEINKSRNVRSSDYMLSEKITQRARRRPLSIFPTTNMYTLKLGLFILNVCPLVLLTNGLAINFHQQERSHQIQSNSMHHHNQHEQQLKDQPPHHETPRHHQKHQQSPNLDSLMSAPPEDVAGVDRGDDLSLVDGHFEPLVATGVFSPPPSYPPSSQTGKGTRAMYACEQKQLDIECQIGESIQLIHANYGHFSIQICNVPGQLNWKVDCVSSGNAKLTPNRRLIKRSGISDQRLAEIQMMRALKKQLDKASKLAASTGGSGSGGQETTS